MIAAPAECIYFMSHHITHNDLYYIKRMLSIVGKRELCLYSESHVLHCMILVYIYTYTATPIHVHLIHEHVLVLYTCLGSVYNRVIKIKILCLSPENQAFL